MAVEAFQYDGDLMNSKGEYYCPEWAVENYKNGILFFNREDLLVRTLEGYKQVTVGDYIIQGVNGELYSCKPDIFERTYDPVKIRVS